MNIVQFKKLLLFCILFSVISCKKNDKPEGAENNNGSVRTVGQPITNGVIELVGPGGGVIQSEDGRLEIEFPAGAVTEETEIGIEPLNNTATSGIGFSYRLTPHGKTFQKKVTLRFHYKNDEHRLAGKEALEIAYQNDKGVWTCIGNAVNDKTNRTISVQTSHFSDWALIASMELSPVVKTVGPGESVTLKALRYVFPAKEDDFLVPLSLPEADTGEPLKLEKQYIKQWSLQGPGKLTGEGSEAVYTAPSTMPANNTATVTVELNVHGKQVLLISTIYIVTEGLELSIDGGSWETYPGIATKMPDADVYSLTNLRVSAGEPQIVFMWPAKTGERAGAIYPWSMLGDAKKHVIFEYHEPGFEKMYVSVYDDGMQTRDSGGFLSVDEKEEGGKKYLTGMFNVDQAALIDNTTGEQVKISSVMGLFKVQRNW